LILSELNTGVAIDIVGSYNIVIYKTSAFGFGADDFGEFLKETKGVYVQIGTANDDNPNTKQSLRYGRTRFNRRGESVRVLRAFCII